jgi:hypothetical protein
MDFLVTIAKGRPLKYLNIVRIFLFSARSIRKFIARRDTSRKSRRRIQIPLNKEREREREKERKREREREREREFLRPYLTSFLFLFSLL